MVPVGATLYKVHALSEPNAPKVHIGDLVVTSDFVKSYFGDRYLYFKHQDMRQDLQIKPEWTSHLQVGEAKCPFSMMKN